jgi:hypothetical protein
MKWIACLVIAAMTWGVESKAQNQYMTWYFGTQAGVSFLRTDGSIGQPVPVDVPMMQNLEGNVLYCHPQRGTVELYSSGTSLLDASGTEVIHGSVPHVIFGSSAAQSGLLLDVPGQPDSLVLIQVPDLTNTIQPADRRCGWSIVHRRDENSSWNKNPGISRFGLPATERLMAVRNADSSGWWVFVMPDDGAVHVHRLRGAVLDERVHAQSNAVANLSVGGQLKVSRDGRFLTVGNIESFVWRIDRSTGTLNEVHRLDFSKIDAIAPKQPRDVYGISFSGTSRYLYITALTRPERETWIFQLDITLPTADEVLASARVVAQLPIGALWQKALQYGPDGAIYIPNGRYLARIPFPDRRAPACGFDLQAVDLVGGQSIVGLPVVLEQTYGLLPPPRVNLTDSLDCATNRTFVRVRSSDTIRLLEWWTSVSPLRQATLDTVLPVDGPVGTALWVYTYVESDVSSTLDSILVVFQERPSLRLPDTVALCPKGRHRVVLPNLATLEWSTMAVDTAADGGIVLGPFPNDERVIAIGTDSAGCLVSDTIYFMRYRDEPKIVVSDSVLCLGDEVEMRVERTIDRQWFPETPFANRLDSVQRFRPTETADYRLLAVSVEGCTTELTQRIVVNPPSTIAIRLEGGAYRVGERGTITVRANGKEDRLTLGVITSRDAIQIDSVIGARLKRRGYGLLKDTTWIVLEGVLYGADAILQGTVLLPKDAEVEVSAVLDTVFSCATLEVTDGLLAADACAREQRLVEVGGSTALRMHYDDAGIAVTSALLPGQACLVRAFTPIGECITSATIIGPGHTLLDTRHGGPIAYVVVEMSGRIVGIVPLLRP